MKTLKQLPIVFLLVCAILSCEKEIEPLVYTNQGDTLSATSQAFIPTPKEYPGEHIEPGEPPSEPPIIFPTVTINGIEWMAENFNYLPEISNSFTRDAGQDVEKACYFVFGYTGNNLEEAKNTQEYETYGVLYNWPAAVAACPDGWHLPTAEEWESLARHIGEWGSYGKDDNGHWLGVSFHLKSDYGWANGQNGSDDFGFNALPAGIFTPDRQFEGKGFRTCFWSSTPYDNGDPVNDQQRAHYITIQSNKSKMPCESCRKCYGFSVRYVKDY